VRAAKLILLICQKRPGKEASLKQYRCRSFPSTVATKEAFQDFVFLARDCGNVAAVAFEETQRRMLCFLSILLHSRAKQSS